MSQKKFTRGNLLGNIDRNTIQNLFLFKNVCDVKKRNIYQILMNDWNVTNFFSINIKIYKLISILSLQMASRCSFRFQKSSISHEFSFFRILITFLETSRFIIGVLRYSILCKEKEAVEKC